MTRPPMANTHRAASPLEARSLSTSSLLVGTRPTVSSTSRTRPRSPMASPTTPSTSSATRPLRAATTTRSTPTPAPSDTPSPALRTPSASSRSSLISRYICWRWNKKQQKHTYTYNRHETKKIQNLRIYPSITALNIYQLPCDKGYYHVQK